MSENLRKVGNSTLIVGASPSEGGVAYVAAGGLAGVVAGGYAATLLPMKWGFVAGIAGVALTPLALKYSKDENIKNNQPALGALAAVSAAPMALVAYNIWRALRK